MVAQAGVVACPPPVPRPRTRSAEAATGARPNILTPRNIDCCTRISQPLCGMLSSASSNCSRACANRLADGSSTGARDMACCRACTAPNSS